MGPPALVPIGVLVGQFDPTSSNLAIKLSRLLQRQRIKLTHLNFPAVTALVLALLTLALALPQAALAASGTWSYTNNSMTAEREDHTATLLADDRVLVAGGKRWVYLPQGGGGYETVPQTELYDPVSKAFTQISGGALNYDRCSHKATLLPNGKVLAAGGGFPLGGSDTLHAIKYAEIFDPATYKWSFTTPMQTARVYHTATLLPNGQVLVTGGEDDNGNVLNSAELYDWTTGSWTYTTHPMSTSRRGHTATLLPSGQVLVAGGYDNGFTNLTSAEVYNPADGTWTSTSPMWEAIGHHTATLMRNGWVLVVGEGFSGRAQVFIPENANWGYAAAGPNTVDYNLMASLLCNGKVLVAGSGFSTVLYDPASFTWAETGKLNTARSNYKATVLANGQVLVTGGENSSIVPSTLKTAELYDPEPPPKVRLPPLQAFYPFDGDARDYSGKHRDCTYPIGYQPQLVPGYQGQAYSFNNDYLSASVNIDPGEYPKLTMGAWAKPTAGGTIAPLLAQDNGGYDRQIGLDTRGGGTGWSAFCGPAGGVLGAVPAIQGKWTFVAVVYDQVAQTVRLQVDDMVLTKSGVTLGSGINYLLIGGSPPIYFNQFFNGVIDNVFVFGGALSDQQLAFIRNGGASAILTATKGPNPGPMFLLMKK